MAKLKLYLDTRRPLENTTCPIKIRVALKNASSFLISTGLYVSEKNWIKSAITGSPATDVARNNALKVRCNKIENELLQLEMSGDIDAFSTATLKKHLEGIVFSRTDMGNDTLLKNQFAQFCSFKTKPSTINKYDQTLIKLQTYYNLQSLRLDSISVLWLKDFEKKLIDEGLSVNTIAIHLRNIRAIFNNAINEDAISLNHYPFRKFKIKTEETIKRSLTIEHLRLLKDYTVEPHQERYRDAFMLIFYLIGINIVDLCKLSKIDDNRVNFHRAKTNKLYSIKVEQEALAIINKYKGKDYLLNFSDNYANYQDFMRKVNNNLQAIGEVVILKHGKKERTPIFPDLTTYWARHTWATIAADLDIPDETISLALGHATGSRITNIYINRNQRKVDEANRKVLDYLLSGE